MKRSRPTAPRVTIYENRRATLSGVEYDELRSIITQASLHNYDAMKRAQKKGDKEYESYAREQLQLLERVDGAIMQAIAASFCPAPSGRTGWRRPVERHLRAMEKAERRRLVEEERHLRQWLDGLLENALGGAAKDGAS